MAIQFSSPTNPNNFFNKGLSSIKNYLSGVQQRNAQRSPNTPAIPAGFQTVATLSNPKTLGLTGSLGVPGSQLASPPLAGISDPVTLAKTGDVVEVGQYKSPIAKPGAPIFSYNPRSQSQLTPPATPATFAPQPIPQLFGGPTPPATIGGAAPQNGGSPAPPVMPTQLPAPTAEQIQQGIPQTSSAPSSVAAPLTTGGTSGGAGTGTGTGTQTPLTGGGVDAATQKAIKDAEKAVEDANKISAEELSSQEDLDKLVEATKKAYLNTSNQPIALDFITGQLKAQEQRALGLAEPLERKLARMQAARTASLASSKFALERADKRAEVERAAKPKAPEPFTLSPGEVRYDANGNIIAAGPAKVKELSAAAEAKALESQDKATAAQQSASQSIGLVNNLLSGDRYKAISGVLQTGSIPFLGDRAAVNEYDQLQGLLKLGIRSLIKGQGSVSDYEGKVLGSAASALSRATNESQMKSALLKVRGVLKTNNGESTEVIVRDKNGNAIGQGLLNGQDIYQAAKDGNTVEYL